MGKPTQNLPDLSGLTEGEIIDKYGEIHAAAKQMDELSEYYKQAIKARFQKESGTKQGSVYVVENKLSQRTAIDQTKAKEILPAEWLERIMKTSDVMTLRVRKIDEEEEATSY